MDALERLERERCFAWSREWPGGIHMASHRFAPDVSLPREVLLARKLGHAVIVTPLNDGELAFFALPVGGPAR